MLVYQRVTSHDSTAHVGIYDGPLVRWTSMGRSSGIQWPYPGHTSVQCPWYLAHPQSEQNTQTMQKNMIWILDKWMDHHNHHAFPYLIIATEAQPQQSHDGMFTDAHSDGVSDGWAGSTIAIMVWLPCLTHPLPNIWVNFITTSRRDRTLESWLIREIIPKWPNNSG